MALIHVAVLVIAVSLPPVQPSLLVSQEACSACEDGWFYPHCVLPERPICEVLSSESLSPTPFHH